MSLSKIVLKVFILLILSAHLIGCETSEKGKWTAADKEKARNEMEKELLNSSGEGGDFFSNKEVRDQFLDCTLSKLEQNYASYSVANQDMEGCKKIGEDCALTLIEAISPAEEDGSAPVEKE